MFACVRCANHNLTQIKRGYISFVLSCVAEPYSNSPKPLGTGRAPHANGRCSLCCDARNTRGPGDAPPEPEHKGGRKVAMVRGNTRAFCLSPGARCPTRRTSTSCRKRNCTQGHRARPWRAANRAHARLEALMRCVHQRLRDSHNKKRLALWQSPPINLKPPRPRSRPARKPSSGVSCSSAVRKPTALCRHNRPLTAARP